MKSNIFRILTMIVLSAGLLFSRVSYVSADNPAGNYYHKILSNGHCVDQRFLNPAEAKQHGFNLPGKCPAVVTPTDIIPTETQVIIPTATNIIPTATDVITNTPIIPTPTNFVITPTHTSVVPTNTARPTATNINPTSTNVTTATPNVGNTATSIPSSATATITPFPLKTNLAVPNCPSNNNGFLPWIFLVLGGIGTGLGISNARTVRKLKNIH